MKKQIVKIYVLFIYLFIYLPIFILFSFSFNKDKLNSTWKGFTIEWYFKLFNNSEVMLAFFNSLSIAFFSSLISVLIGSIISFLFYNMDFKGKKIFEIIIKIPIILPDLVIGIGLLAFFVFMKITLGTFSVFFAHLFFTISYSTLIISTRFEYFDNTLIDAAKDLGANPKTIFFKIIIPIIFPGVLSAFLISFILSWDDFIIAFFTNGPGGTTLPIKIYSMLKFGVDPQINALSSLMVITSAILMFVFLKIQKNY